MILPGRETVEQLCVEPFVRARKYRISPIDFVVVVVVELLSYPCLSSLNPQRANLEFKVNEKELLKIIET